MKLNKKGITLIEIIISIALISIVLIYMFSLLITVRDMNSEAETNTTYLINKSLFLKAVESDLVEDEDGIEIGTCSIKEDQIEDEYPIKSNIDSSNYFELNSTETKDTIDKRRAYECISIKYAADDIGYVAIYYYKPEKSYVITYKRNDIAYTYKLPDFEVNNVYVSKISNPLQLHKKTSKCIYQTTSTPSFKTPNNCRATTDTFYTIEIPIVGNDSKDYTILISYYGKVEVN